MVNYYEGPGLVIPDVHTYLFVSRERDDTGRDFWLFREPPTPGPEGDADPPDEMLTQFDEDSLYQILDLRGLI